MQVQVNGEPRETSEGQTLAGLLEELGIEATQVAVEWNREVVRRSLLGQRRLAEGDRVEVVRFVGGG
ncbi:MAG: sulfur carrier protein ThiS [Planctomycetes bacterium]|nr:sulfur carrier protein ThiS [Planctomycetota bacterium]